ncbi:hypothetical protein CLPU_2c00920 [Gottschalkia purinilytica]|uniref:Motility protein n=1 Tax=Gottschalkia purinilytica TaxID=1503 RepID=A0A0L0WDX7_GOTPU|nr:YjfB family protein [Gottschalkia purinilytica]KNF09641.1 hypothetical protein CLPU_2c00920 [Gottschalkia purinilytica]
MDIAMLSTALGQMKAMQQANLSVMKMAMDNAKIQTTDLTQMIQQNTKMMEQSVTPHIGGNIDINI